MISYVDSKPVGESKDIPLELTAVFGQQPGEKIALYREIAIAGRSQSQCDDT
jgi:hypothetical protein